MKSFNFIPMYRGTFFIYGQLSWDLWEHIHKENIPKQIRCWNYTETKVNDAKERKKSFWENNENVIAAGAVRCNLLDMFCYVVTTFNADCKIPQSNKMLSKFVPRYPAAQSKLYVWFNVSPEIVKIHAEFQNIWKTKSSTLKTFHIYSMIWILNIVASQVLH